MLPSHHGFRVVAARSSGSGIGWSRPFGAASSNHHPKNIAQRKFNESYSWVDLARLRPTAFLRRGRCFDLPSRPAVFCRLFRRRWGSLHPPTQPAGFGHFRTLRSILRGDHRVRWWQAPFGPIFSRRHLVISGEVALEHLDACATIETDDVIAEDQFLHGHRWFGLDRFSRCPPNRGNRLMHGANQAR
jgi:hypothetical protein